MTKKLLFVLLVCALLLSACDVRVEMPRKELGPEVVDEIQIANPDVETALLTLEFGAGTL